MKKTTNLLLIVFMLAGFTKLYAQSEKVSLSGTVLDSKSRKPIEMVVVNIKELNMWTTTNKKGEFNFKKLPSGSYTIYSSCLGYEDYLKKIELKKTIPSYKLMLKKRSLALKEIVVTAKENKGTGTSSKIEKSALEHIQPMSLSDVMQLVPGQVSLNPDLKKANQISIREIYDEKGPDKTGALGTAIIVNGSPLSNDANMQLVSTAKSGTSSDFSSSAGGGVDLRQISPDNIESVEVIRGIASVEYGEMTSGAVIVNTKAGKSPLRAKVKVDANTKQIYAGKGYFLGGNKGSLNFDIDYTHAYDDIRSTSTGYNRYTGQLSYSNVFFKGNHPLSFNSKLSFYSSEDEDKQDKDMAREEIFKSKDRGVSLSINGNWAFNKPWITNIKYSMSASYSHQESYIKKLQSNNGVTPVATSLIAGEFQGLFLPNEYYSELNIDGKPINLFAKITANLAGKYGNIYNKFLLGVEWRTNGNNGDGRTFDMEKPHSPASINALRPRSYKDIPFLNQYSVFMEEKMKLSIGSTILDIQAGVRVNNLRPNGLFKSGFDFSCEPRLNLKYSILNGKNNSLFDDLAIRAGYGINIKNPTLIHFFPDKAYFDLRSFNYYPNLVAMTTKVIDDTSNPNLKAAENTKKELGLDFKIDKVSVSITGFKESLKDGFSFESVYDIMEYKVYDELGEGFNPVFQNGQVMVDGMPHTYAMDTVFNKYSTPRNNYTLDKEGIEYSINFGKINALRTSLIVDGAYMKTEKVTTGESMYYPGGTLGSKKYPFVGIYASGEGETRKRFNTNFRFVTHVPEVKMVMSVTAQVIWMEEMNRTYESGDGKVIPYMVDGAGKKITGNEVYSNAEIVKVINPVSYMDKTGNILPFTSANETNDIYHTLIKGQSPKYYLKESYPTSLQINMRLSKDLGKNMNISFFANNVFNNRPLFKYDRSDSYARRNSPFYFGAELKMKF